MISIIRITDHRYGGKRTSAIYEFTCSSASDVENLPTAKSQERPYKTTYPRPGSSCICTDGGLTAYMLGADDEWHLANKS